MRGHSRTCTGGGRLAYTGSPLMSGSESIAEDVIQEVFLALIRDVGNYDSQLESVAAFLYGIARNKVQRSIECESRPGVEQAVVLCDLQEMAYEEAAHRHFLRPRATAREIPHRRPATSSPGSS